MRHAYDSLKRLTKQLEAAKAFDKVGMAPHLNVLQNEVQLSKAEQDKIRIANQIRNYEVTLNRLLGFSSDEKIIYKGKLNSFGYGVPFSEVEAVKTAMIRRPDLIIANKSISAAVKDSHITAGHFLPKVDIVYDNMKMKRNYQEDFYTDYTRSYWSVTLNFRWDIFEGGHTSFSYARDKKRIQSLQKEYENSMLAAKTDIVQVFMDMQTADELIQTAKKILLPHVKVMLWLTSATSLKPEQLQSYLMLKHN
jgi:outer membrane protein TolC